MFENAQDRREREALAWVQMLNDESVSELDVENYLAWMEADQLNAEIFRDLDSAWIAAGDAADSIRSRFGPEARENDAVKTLPPLMGALLRPWWRPQLAAACVMLLIVGVVLFPNQDSQIESLQYATEIGERRDISLEDGSTVTLNTGSSIQVAFQNNRRIVTLTRGGALFDVQPDASRPFVVRMDGGAVEVLGTVFDVLRQGDGFAVTVLEGRVSVSADVDGPVPNKAVVLTSNQSADVNTQLASITSYAVDAVSATAWQRGQLIYKDALLGEVLEDINRYSLSPLSLQTRELEAMTFTGVLTIEAPEVMAQRLAGLMQLTVVSEEGGGLRLEARP